MLNKLTLRQKILINMFAFLALFAFLAIYLLMYNFEEAYFKGFQDNFNNNLSQISRDQIINYMNREKQDFFARSVAGIIIALIISFWLTYIIVNRLFEDLSFISKEVKKINVNSLDYKIKTNQLNEEFEDLANKVNNLTDKLESSLAKEKRLTLNVAHELRTPLSIILGEIEVQEMQEKDSKTLEMLSHLKKQSLNLIDIVENILTNKKKKNIKEIQLENIINQNIKILQKEIDLKKIKIKIDKKDTKKIKKDEFSINLIIKNLIENAVKYSKVQSKIIIIINANKLTIINETNEKFNKKKNFEPFYRGDKSRNKNIKGYGLGLSIINDLCKEHKYKINSMQKNSKVIFDVTF